MKKLCLILMMTITGVTATWGQHITWDDFADLYFNEREEGGEEDLSLYDELLEIHRNPINLNLAQRTDLLRLPFINEQQADSILSLIKRFHGFYSLGELQFVRNLNHKEISFMPLFFYCDRDAIPDSIKAQYNSTGTSQWRGSRRAGLEKKLTNELSTTLNIPLYKREGFKSHTAEELEKNPNKQYLGNNLATTLRYRAALENRLFWGLTAQKDEGEPFCTKDNTLYDSYSFYIMGKGNGHIKQWILGDYRAQFGLGLTMGSSTPDAMNILSSYNPRQQGFTRHTSTDEALFLRGGAITAQYKKFTFHAFASWRQLDATLYKDSISTILTDGYHRTPLEMSKRHNIQSLQGGFSTTINLHRLTLGLQATHTHYDTPYRTPTSLYRKYYFQGKDFGNYSISYAYSQNAFKLWGETATSLQGGIASLHRMQYAPKSRLKIIALHRYYTTHYLSTSAQSYKIGSRIQNEHGVLVGLNWQPNEFWTIRTYADYAHYPFATYYTDHPADAYTAALQTEFTPSSDCTILFRYKYRQRPQDNNLDQLDSKQSHIFKLQARYTLGKVSMTTGADLMLLSQPNKKNTSGWMLSHKATANLCPTTRASASVALFHTDSYAEALRLYEPTLLYATSYPTCYYHGQRLALSMTQKIGIIQLAVKYSLTNYTDRKTIGSGLRAYNGSTPQEIILQGILNF